jgi:hypothetical protein
VKNRLNLWLGPLRRRPEILDSDRELSDFEKLEFELPFDFPSHVHGFHLYL